MRASQRAPAVSRKSCPRKPNAQWSTAHTGADELDGRYDSRKCPSPRYSVKCASSVPTSTSWSSVSIRRSTPLTSSAIADSMRSVASSPRFYVSSAVDSRTSGFHLSLRDPLAGWGGAPPPAVDPSSRAGYLSCPNDNAVHDRSGHPGGYHNPGWKNAERSGGV